MLRLDYPLDIGEEAKSIEGRKGGVTWQLVFSKKYEF